MPGADANAGDGSRHRRFAPGAAPVGGNAAIPIAWHAVLVVLAVAVVYANTLDAGFLWDDLFLVVGNPAIKRLANAPALFWSDLFPAGIDSGYYRPLQALTYALDYGLWGLAPAGYHLTSVALHAATAVLLYRVGCRVLASATAALIGALLFAVHPLHVEAVAYVSGRSDPLAALCMLIAVLGFLRDGPRAQAWSAVAYFLALLAREAAFVLPLLLWVVDRVPPGRGRRPVSRYLPYAVALGGHLVLRAASHAATAAVPPTASVPLGFRLLTMAEVIAGYLGLVIVPVGLHMERVVAPVESVADPRALAALAGVGLVVAAAVVLRRRAWPVTLGIAWFGVALLPVANLVPLATFMAEHWLYVPLMGLGLAAGWTVDHLASEPRVRLLVLAAVVPVVALYGGLTVRQNAVWHDGRTLYEYLLPLAPESARVRVNLAQVYHEAGELERARVLYEDVARLRPNDRATADAQNNLGNILRADGAAADALTHYDRALVLRPDHVAARNGRALALQDLGRIDEAERALTDALVLAPTAATTHSNLGNLYFRRGELERAREHYLVAVHLDPDYADAHNNLGSVYYRLGDRAAAEAEYRTALRLNPASEGARRNLAIVLGE